MKICLDTQILVWGIRETSTPGQEGNIAYAKRLLDTLRGEGNEIIVPAIVIAEILTALPVEVHAMTMNLFDQAFECAPFDVGCAGRFAEVWQAKKDASIVESLIGDECATKQELKADCLIVATAI
jgi:predicted nucleic acid-binding protein